MAVRYDRQTGGRTVVGEDIRDFLADGPHLWALSAAPGATTFQLRDIRNPAIAPNTGTFSDPVLELFKTSEGVGVLTNQAVYLLAGNRWQRTDLPTTVDRYARHVAEGAPGSIYFGREPGEFGGSLERIDLASGQVWSFGVEDQDPCEADFDPQCDPIVGLTPDPQRPGCVTAASGAVHMGMTEGRIYRACGNTLTLTYTTPNRTPILMRLLAPTKMWQGLTAPLESLTQTRDGWVAMSWGRYFQMKDGEVSEHRLPDFEYWHDLRISAEKDGVIILVGGASKGPATERHYWPIAIPVLD
ncbi:MAG: hypothetical protein HZY74_11340 [Brevundimonas sp.]|nr:MAG: hypothetical protein HZY74_11340 [Brevundimonas sp.]